MTQIIKIITLAVALTFSLPSNAIAAEVNCGISTKVVEGSLFNDIVKAGKLAARELCQSLLVDKTFNPGVTNNRLQQALLRYGETSAKVIEQTDLYSIADFRSHVEAMLASFSAFADNQDFPLIIVDKKFGSSSREIFFEGVGEDLDKVAIPGDDPRCGVLLPGQDCKAVFEQLMNAFNVYREPFERFVSDRNRVLIDQLGSDWDRFLEVSKSQTALEVGLTSWFQGSHFKKDYLVGPPKYQIIALHPQVIYDSNSNAPAGERLETGIALELLGINFWNASMPFGISYTRTYVDRPTQKPFAHGIMLHFDNKYSIGVADHDGDDSVFVTLDLLKLIEDKKANMKRYLSFAAD